MKEKKREKKKEEKEEIFVRFLFVLEGNLALLESS